MFLIFLTYFVSQVLTSPVTIQILPPPAVQACDAPYDEGEKIIVKWQLSPDDSLISGYEIWRSSHPDTGYQFIGYTGRGSTSFVDGSAKDGISYHYRLKSRGTAYNSDFSSVSSPAISSPQWYDKDKTNVLIALFIFSFIILGSIAQAKRGKSLFIRKINGLDALDEAVGRATEMGKPVLYVPGLGGIGDIATIAAINILSQVAKKTAEYNTPILVPNCDPIVMTVTQEVVKEAYLSKGRPEGYNPDHIYFMVGSQFAYAAGITGIMMRERPATNLFMGYFAAESLILAEAGNITGAIQIAGCDAVTQLPFFITACDYTIMGEELYAASAYLSREPLLVGSIKGQDYNKLILLFFLLLGSIVALFGSAFIVNWFHS